MNANGIERHHLNEVCLCVCLWPTVETVTANVAQNPFVSMWWSEWTIEWNVMNERVSVNVRKKNEFYYTESQLKDRITTTIELRNKWDTPTYTHAQEKWKERLRHRKLCAICCLFIVHDFLLVCQQQNNNKIIKSRQNFTRFYLCASRLLCVVYEAAATYEIATFIKYLL